MKNLLPVILLLCLFTTDSFAQLNYVPNGNFEYSSPCPNTLSQVNRCQGWSSYTQGTPDYFNNCAGGTFVNVPQNFIGWQKAASGSAYVGGYFYDRNSNVNFKEYITREIIPLTAGKAYRVSVSVSLANGSRYATNDMGVYFYDTNVNFVNTLSVLNVTPQISYSDYGPITDTAGWVRMSKIFVADSAYDHIVVGGFKSYNNLTKDSLQTSGTVAYYYIDSLVVNFVDSLEIASVSDTILCVGDTFSVDYSTLATYNTSNVFKVQLSDATGSFSNPIDIGSKASDTAGTILCTVPSGVSIGKDYVYRIVSSLPADTTTFSVETLDIANPDSVSVTLTSTGPTCDGVTTLFYGTADFTPNTFSWTGPNGFAYAGANPYISATHMSHAGKYYAEIKFNGCVVKDSITLVVKPLPTKPVASADITQCAGDTLRLGIAGSAIGTTYQWTGPSFSSNNHNPVVSNSSTVAMSGSYIVTANLNGCTSKDTTLVIVRPYPTALNITSNSPICNGENLQLNGGTATTGATYVWTANNFSYNGINAGITNATPAQSGWYKLTADLYGCVLRDSIYATVAPIPAQPVLTYNTLFCQGETITINASNVPGASYTWTGPNNYGSNQQNATRSNMQFTDTGLYSVVVSVGNCAAQPVSARININPLPFVTIIPTPGDTICQGEPIVLNAYPNNAGANPQYRWEVNAQTVGTGAVYTSTGLNDGDIVGCYMTETTKCSSPYTDESNFVQVAVLPWVSSSVSITATPNGPINKDEYIVFNANAVSGGTIPQYQWMLNGKKVSGATGKTWSANTFNDNDEVSVELISNYRCPKPAVASSNKIKVKVLNSVGTVAGIDDLLLFPNPNDGRFVLSGRVSTKGAYTIDIMNVVGGVVYKGSMSSQNGLVRKEINTGTIPSGIYLLRLTDSKGNVGVMKFIVD